MVRISLLVLLVAGVVAALLFDFGSNPAPGVIPDDAVAGRDAEVEVVRPFDAAERVRDVPEPGEKVVTGADAGQVDAAPEPQTAVMRSHGPLPAASKQQIARKLELILRGDERQLRAAREKGDLDKEAIATVALHTHRVMQARLQSDDYVTLDVGMVQEVWPVSPRGWKVVRMNAVPGADGTPVETVFAIEVAEDRDLEDAVAYRREIKDYLAAECAYKFNGLADARRYEARESFDRLRAGDDADVERTDDLRLLLRALKGPFKLAPNLTLVGR